MREREREKEREVMCNCDLRPLEQTSFKKQDGNQGIMNKVVGVCFT